jgi:hypothetical protein
VSHPARYTPAILEAVVPVLTQWGLPIHDPFSGTGERLGALCDQLGLTFTGTEIEPEFIVDGRVRPGDSTQPASYPTRTCCIVTSPTYPNGMADHFRARDGSRRHTYRQALATTTGSDRELHPHNSGRYTVRHGAQAEARYWQLMHRAVAHWPARVVVDLSDFITAGRTYPLVDKWIALLVDYGYEIADPIEVETPRQRHGANGEARAETEAILIGIKQERSAHRCYDVGRGTRRPMFRLGRSASRERGRVLDDERHPGPVDVLEPHEVQLRMRRLQFDLCSPFAGHLLG